MSENLEDINDEIFTEYEAEAENEFTKFYKKYMLPQYKEHGVDYIFLLNNIKKISEKRA